MLLLAQSRVWSKLWVQSSDMPQPLNES